jgi:lysophospholipase L1-like esterase
VLRYLALGDSYTLGEGVPPWEIWPVRLVVLLRREGLAVGYPEIVARTGWTTTDLAAAIDTAAPRGPFDLVSLHVGVNDQYRGGHEDDYQPAFRALLARAAGFAKGDAARVLVLSIPDWGATPFARDRDRAAIATSIDRFNAINRDETLRLGARYIDVTVSSRRAGRPGSESLLAADGLHPSGVLYEEWARLALPHALAAIAGRPVGR